MAHCGGVPIDSGYSGNSGARRYAPVRPYPWRHRRRGRRAARSLLWLVVIADSRPEPQRVVLLCVGLGAISTLPAYAIEAWVDAHIPITSNLWSTAYEAALLSAGLPEEALKVSIIAAVAWRVRDFDEPMDGVVYGTAVRARIGGR